MALRKTSIEQLSELFVHLGLHADDIVMVHSAIFTLGIIEGGLVGIYTAIRRVVGDAGTIIVPTFTYSFRKNEIYDVRNTPVPKTLGVFSEYVRTRADAIRSADPLFSMSAIGPEASALMKRENRNCFGDGSIYEKLFRKDMLILALGITYDTGISAFMHLEKLAGVDYRLDLEIHGRTIGADGVEYDDSAVHFVRNAQKYPNYRRNRIPFGLQMERDGVSKAVDYGSGHHMAMRAKIFEEYTLDALKHNPFLMAQGILMDP